MGISGFTTVQSVPQIAYTCYLLIYQRQSVPVLSHCFTAFLNISNVQHLKKKKNLFHHTCAKPNHRIPSDDLDHPHSLNAAVLVHIVSNSDAIK